MIVNDGDRDMSPQHRCLCDRIDRAGRAKF
jgi:hypothetical protein